MRNASKTTTTAASDTRVLKREPESGRKAPLNHIVFTLKEEHYTTGKVIQPVVKKTHTLLHGEYPIQTYCISHSLHKKSRGNILCVEFNSYSSLCHCQS